MSTSRSRPRLGDVPSRMGPAAACALLLLCAAPVPSPAVVAPPGYYAFEYISGLDRPTSLVFGPDGTLYVAEMPGKVVAVRDVDGNGLGDTVTQFQTGLSITLGATWRNGGVFASSLGHITKLTDTDGDFVADVVDTVVNGIPYGLHQNNGITFGPDGLLYVAVGSQSENSAGDPWSAAIVRFTEAGDFVDVFANGFRNPYDLAFFESKNKLFTTDNSPSGDSTFMCFEAPDELNQVNPGGFYGFPYCFGVGDCVDVGCDPPLCGPGSCSRGSGCNFGVQEPVLLLDPHSAPTGMCFGDGFKGFDGQDLFVAEFGQGVPVEECPTDFGHQVLRIRVNAGGNVPAGTVAEPFLTDIPRPTDVAVGPDSALYVSDFSLGKVFRVIKTGQTGIGDGRSVPRPRLWVSPNPARGRTTLYWEGAPAGAVEYGVFDLAGREVARILSPDADPRVWPLRDGAGRRVAAGLYVIRASGGGREATAKVLVTD